MWTPWRRSQQRKLVQSFGKKYPHTHDIHELEESKYKLLFVMDDMKRGHKNYSLIEKHSKPVSRGFTQEVLDYRVGKFTGKAVPFMANEGLKVKGQLHAVESRHIPEVDNHYRNGVEFARVRANIIVVDRENITMSIGSEEFVKELPPGMLLTSHHTRHYIAEQPRQCIIQASMYVAMRVFWDDEDFGLLQRPRPEFPKHNILWLPKYYNYPIERNRCPPK